MRTLLLLFRRPSMAARSPQRRIDWMARFGLALAALLSTVPQITALNLQQAVIVDAAPAGSRQVQAARMLSTEIARRSPFRLPIRDSWPEAPTPVIVLGTYRQLQEQFGSRFTSVFSADSPSERESFRLMAQPERTQPVIWVVGHDSRGVLFGAGKLLRTLAIGFDSVEVPDDLNAMAAPRYPLRGHQLGFRPKTNSYDAWDLDQWEQYFRDLIVFGSNAIELIPPRSDDDRWSPHFKRTPLDMMIGMSTLADSYDLDVWIWYPALDKDYSDPNQIARAVDEWAVVFSKLPRIDAVFVPGGDPGHTPPKILLGLLEKQAQSLRRFHPAAQMWVSPQGFDRIWMEDFLGILKKDHPGWLSGIVYGPQVRVTMKELRESIPADYPIRHYPDITHSRQCQFPVPDWDRAYALTEARECINPRPMSEAAIFHHTQPGTVGFISYSEGCNDDVNKMIWSALGWDPDRPVVEILREYGRYFIGAAYADSFARGLLALERNWAGPLLANQGVEITLRQFQTMEAKAAPAVLRNWRFQQALLRAYYDAYIRRRLLSETDSENRAMDALANARTLGARAAMEQAERLLAPSAVGGPDGWRTRILQLGEALFQSIGMQLSVERYQAIAIDRGACLDTLDFPLNDRVWLKEQFSRIRRISSESERLGQLDQIINWTNPGPGGFYDDLGNPALQPHLVVDLPYEADPGAFQRPRSDFEEDLVVDEPDEKPSSARRLSWTDHAEVLYDRPLKMRYTQLDPAAQYQLRVVYAGDALKKKIRLVANGTLEIHSFLRRPFPFEPLTFDLPRAATAGGDLNLAWFCEPGLGGNGRGCQVSEVWLLRK